MQSVRTQATSVILDELFEHFRKYGVKSMSMDDIARQYGMSKKTLYQHFENKKDLIFQAMSRHTALKQQLMDEITANSFDAVDEMVQMAEDMVLHFRQIKPVLIQDLQKYYRQVWNFVMANQHEYFTQKIKSNLARGVQEGYYRASIDADIVSKLYVSKTLSLVNEELFSLVEYQREHLLRQHVLYHIYGVLSPKGQDHFEQFNLFKDSL